MCRRLVNQQCFQRLGSNIRLLGACKPITPSGFLTGLHSTQRRASGASCPMSASPQLAEVFLTSDQAKEGPAYRSMQSKTRKPGAPFSRSRSSNCTLSRSEVPAGAKAIISIVTKLVDENLTGMEALHQAVKLQTDCECHSCMQDLKSRSCDRQHLPHASSRPSIAALIAETTRIAGRIFTSSWPVCPLSPPHSYIVWIRC